MNRKNIVSIAKRVFGDINPVKEDLYRGNIILCNKRAGVYFLDFNQDITLNNFFQYQDALLSNEYYNLEGDQQWNFYLFLLRDIISIDFKTVVESNDKYARKYVFREEEFVDFFKIDKSPIQIKTTLIDDWKKKLDSAFLPDIYGDTAIKSVINKLEIGSFSEESIEKKAVGPIDKINKVSRIDLKQNYRGYPKTRRIYEFKKVNLITGINGSGKTSLFEAIELAICGMSFRNPTFREKDGCVEALFNNSSIPEVCRPSQVELYRKRDIEWYGSTSLKLNRLHYSFNRYNFFNADAAQQFASSSNEDDVRNALYKIILGPEYDYILARVDRIMKEIRPIFHKFESEYNEWKKKQNEAEDFIRTWKEDSNLKKLGQIINSKISKLKSIIILPAVSNSFIEIEKFLSDIQLVLNELLKSNIANPEALELKRVLLLRQKEKLKVFMKEDIDLSKKAMEFQEKFRELEYKSELLAKAKKFFSNETLFKIGGLQKKMIKDEALLNKIKTVRAGLGSLNSNPYYGSQKLNSVIENTNTEYDQCQNELYVLEKDFQITIEKLESVQKEIKQLKLLGHSIVENNLKMHKCPLCGANYSRVELVKRIYSILRENESPSSTLSQINERIQVLRKRLLILNNSKEVVSKLRVAWETITSPKVIEDAKLSTIIDNIQRFLDKETEIKIKYKRGQSILELGKQYKITEETYNDLKVQLNKAFPNQSFVYSNRSFYLRKAEKVLIEITNLRREQNTDDRRKKEVAKNLVPLQGIVENGEKEFSFLKVRYKNLQNLIEIDGRGFKEIQFEVSRIQSDLETYKQGLRMEIERKVMIDQKENSDLYISRNSKRFERYRIAYNTLKSIQERSSDEQINTFFQKHLVEIMDIFKTIHSPREFKNIIIDKKGFIKLYTLKDEEREITQISTGQRSALALSIFLTLNRSLKNGPDIMIFDDSIAHTDDLNALSFLDYLRFFVLNENKQIFFATANMKFSNLFEKKFLFLGNDFKKWELHRPD